MSKNRLLELPVVVVGKDRTRMTCAVIDHLKAHIKNAKPYFICVSDRSRSGHDKVIENHLRSIGEERFEVLRTLPEENRYGWGCAINLGLQCAFDQCLNASFALVVDNDWLLQRDLDMEKYDYAFAMSEVGAVTFKSVNPGTNVSLAERKLDDGSVFLLRDRGTAPRYSFTAEIGCMLITRRLRDRYGDFMENCVTDKTEWAFCEWYNSLSAKERSDSRLWFATDKELFHEELNGENHVFTHVGLVSQHEGPHKWNCPDEYKYLSDDSADEQVCKGAVLNDLLTIDDTAATNDGNYWERHKVLFVTNTTRDEKNPLHLSIDLVRRFSPDEVYVVSQEKYGGEVFPCVFEYGIEHGYDYVIYFDADCFILSESNLKKEFERFASNERNIFGGMPDGEACSTRVKNPVCINPFLFFVNLKRVANYRQSAGIFDFGEIDASLTKDVVVGIQPSLAESLDWSADLRKSKGASTKEQGNWKNLFGYENYHRLLCGRKVFTENDVYYMKVSDFNCDADNQGITTAVWSECESLPLGKIETLQDVESMGLVCIHTWYARLVIDTPLEPNPQGLIDFHRKRIVGVVTWVKSVMESSQIAWEKYFDRVYCIHYLPQENKLPRLKRELARVGLLNSPVFEFRYTSECRYDIDVCDAHKVEVPHLNQAFVNIILEIHRILEEAIHFNYSRILLMENDIAFLKDVSLIRRMLDNAPRGFGLIQYDKFVNDGPMVDVYRNACEGGRVNDWFVEYRQGVFSSAACFSLDAAAIRELKALIDVSPNATDTYFHLMTCRKAFSVPNLVIQVFSPGAWSIKTDGVEYMHKVYKNGDVKYEDYNLPDGYTYGSLYDGEDSVTSVILDEQPAVHKNILCLKDLVDSIGKKDIAVLEIGSMAGNSAEVFLLSGKVAHITCVDPWINIDSENPCNSYSNMTEKEMEFDRRMARFGNKVTKFKGTFREFIGNMGTTPVSYDLVYIDALHDYENVKRDISDALTYIRPKIAIAGHDYNPDLIHVAGVKRAVDEAFNGDIKVFGDTSWLHMITEDADLSCGTSPVSKHRKFISVYAIAKNESSVARRWYECVKEADEVCVLDTGSTDDTVEILRSLGAKVTVKTYDDWSFAVARNDSMSFVSPGADILFTLDLDETIAPGWRKKLEDAWVKREQSGVTPTGCVYKYIWSFHPDGTEAQSFSVRKIHAKGQGKWKYRCHELLTEVDDSRSFFLDGFVVEHHQNRQTNRSKYLPLLEKDAKEMPDNDRSAYYYARELMYMGRWQESLDEFKRHLSLPSARWAAERASSMRNIASCYGQLGNMELCELWLRKSADEDPTNREATFRLGEIAMEQKDYPAAVAAFRRCLAIEKPSLEYISIPIVWSARPWFLYAQALWWTGDWKGAEEASRKALEIEPNNLEVRSQYVGMASTRKKFNR